MSDEHIKQVTTSMHASGLAGMPDSMRGALKQSLMQQLINGLPIEDMPDAKPENWLAMLAAAHVVDQHGETWRFYEHLNGVLYLYNSDVYEITDAHNAIKLMGETDERSD